MEDRSPMNEYAQTYMPPKPQLLIVTMTTAASILGETLENTERLVYAGHIVGFLPFKKGGWHVVLSSLEQWVGHPINLPMRQEEEIK